MKVPFVSIVIPVRNVEKILPDCLQSLIHLEYPRDRYEIIIADSLSSDSTCQIAVNYGARVVSTPERSVCAGRNTGFKASKGELVAFSDADCTMDKKWLINALKYFQDDSVAAVGGPNLVPPDDSHFSQAVDVQFALAFYIIKAAPVRILDRVIETRSHGSNVIFRKDVLERVMPVPSELIEGEDVEMNNRVSRLGYKLLYVPDVIVWHRRRSNPRRWFKQMYTYGIGKFLVCKKDKSACNPLHIVLGGVLPILSAAVLVLILTNPELFTPLLVLAGVITFGLMLGALWDKKNLLVAIWFPVVACLSLAGWSLGFLRAALLGQLIQFKRVK